ncbi:MAG: 2-oxoisovalerate dehydrogenase [Planctomycetes bacterium]|nr:2-oxoisovalerate dehydrogenase [Planctomycetota bacterium]
MEMAERGQIPDVDLLRMMLLSREGDRREAILMRQGKSWIQIPSMGHEAVAALAYHLLPDDYLFPYYRDRLLFLVRGVSLEELARSFFANARSSTAGRNMPVHCTAKHLNLFPSTTPTGSHYLPAVGVAWGISKALSSQVVLCTSGDASVRQGEFYEAVCFAVQESLPIVFAIEDNGYGISTPTENLLPFRLRIFNEKFVSRVNARWVSEVYDKGGQAIEKARNGGGPTILWCEVDRLGSHTNADDHRLYRPAKEIEAMMKRDPLKLYAEELMRSGKLTPEEYRVMEGEARQQIDALYLRLDREPPPDPADVLHHLYAAPCSSYSPVTFQPVEETITMVHAINRTFDAALEKYPEMIFFGEDIEDPKGGVFGFTKGLSRKFPGRVINAPLAEATIVGTGVGLASTGYRPVFEIQFIDFITPGFHQLVTQVATLRWRSTGDWICPLVLYAPYGAYLPGGGIWHSQSNEGWWTHIPGLRVAVPSTPEDAVGLFWSAFQDEDPSLILVPKHLFRKRMPVRPFQPLPFGQAAVRREGRDVSLVAWGNGTELAEEAARLLEPGGVSAEIIDLRTLMPCDWAAVELSLAKTGRLVVIQEDNRTCGFGQAVIAEMVSHPTRFHHLLSPPQLVARKDVPVPYHPRLEYAVLPDVDQVVQAALKTME